MSMDGEPLSRTRTILLYTNVGIAYTVWGLLMSLLPTFYPFEAERKGATSLQYGFVFGIAPLAALLAAPIFGRYGHIIGPKLLYNAGAFVQASVGIAFGFLAYFKDSDPFIWCSYILRSIEGIGEVAAWTAVMSILIDLYPEKIGKIMSYGETFKGIGFSLGPALGAFLYSLGGFTLPFVSVGAVAFVCAVGLVFTIPKVNSNNNVLNEMSDELIQRKPLTYKELIKYPSIMFPFFDNLMAFFGNGMTSTLMAPHLRDAGATSQTTIGNVYLIYGLFFAVVAPFCGYICDRLKYPSMLSCVGNTILILGFLLIGPAPFVPFEPTVLTVASQMCVLATGYSLVMVSTFARAQGAATRWGFPKDIRSYLFISGMWTWSFYLGMFGGSTLAGYLMEAVGFRTSTVFFVGLFTFVLICDLFELRHSINVGIVHNSPPQLSGYQSIPE